MHYVIIGACIAAAGAIEGIRSIDREGRITVIDGEKIGAYARPLISYYLKEPKKYHDVTYRSQEFFDSNTVKVIKARAAKINRENKTVILDNNQEIFYDRLLLATGAVPIIPRIDGITHSWVRTFYTMEDAHYLNDNILDKMQAVIIGAGLIGVKAAEALSMRGLQVTLVEKEDRILPRIMSRETSLLVSRQMEKQGINIMTSSEVTAIKAEHQVLLKNGLKLNADLVIMSLGTRPQIELAVECGLNANRGIVVDANLRTSDEDIFAAGDVIETHNVLTGTAEVMALLPHAHREGYLAGCNMAGKVTAYPGGIFINSVQIAGCSICSAGDIADTDVTVFIWREAEKRLELHVRDGYLIQYTAVNLNLVAGPLTNMIAQKIQIPEETWQEFISLEPSRDNIPELYWQEVRK